MLSSESFSSDEKEVLLFAGLIEPRPPVAIPIVGLKREDPPTVTRLFLSGVIDSDERVDDEEEEDVEDDVVDVIEGETPIAIERRFAGDATDCLRFARGRVREDASITNVVILFLRFAPAPVAAVPPAAYADDEEEEDEEEERDFASWMSLFNSAYTSFPTLSTPKILQHSSCENNERDFPVTMGYERTRRAVWGGNFAAKNASSQAATSCFDHVLGSTADDNDDDDDDEDDDDEGPLSLMRAANLHVLRVCCVSAARGERVTITAVATFGLVKLSRRSIVSLLCLYGTYAGAELRDSRARQRMHSWRVMRLLLMAIVSRCLSWV